MTIVQHNFDGNLIAQSGEMTEIMGHKIPKGWVNATAMCKANNKTWSNYWKTDKAKSFASKVSTALLSGSPAIISIEGGNEKDLQGTWVHIKVAIHLAMWISDDFALWATDVLMRVLNNDFKALTEEAEEAQRKLTKLWGEVRVSGIQTRKSLTASIQDWYVRNPGATTRPLHTMISTVTNLIYQKLWGMDAIELENYLGCGRHESRDYLDSQSLRVLERAEDNVIDFICEDNIKPVDAVPIANIRRKPLPTKP